MVDESGKQRGRGAYLCRNLSCWERALKSGNLSRALRTTLNSEEIAQLRRYAATLAKAENPEL